MKPWGTMRREILGMWRSVRYDLDRRTGTREEDGAADWYSRPVPDRDRVLALLRDPRRVGMAVGVSSIIAASATGTYFAVVGGLGILLADAAGVPVVPQAAPFAPFAPLAPGPDETTSKSAGHHGHRSSHQTKGKRTHPAPAPAPAAPAAVVAIDDPKPVPSRVLTSVPVHHSPVPESTGTVTASQSPSATASPSVSASPGYPSPDAGR